MSKLKQEKMKETTYAALEGTAVDVVAIELADGHGGVFVGIHLDEGKTSIRLETGFGHVAKVLEQRDEIRLSGVRSEVTDVAGGLPLRSLLYDHIVALHSVGGEVVVSERSGRRHAHGCHSLLLRDGGLTLLVRPVAADGTRAKPFAVHGAEGPFGIGAIAESDETVAARPACLHIPHDTSLGDGTKSREGLQEDFIVDLVGQIADEDVEVVRGVFLGRVVGLIGPIDTDFLRLLMRARGRGRCRGRGKGRGRGESRYTYVVVHAATVEGLHGAFGGARVVEFDETVVESLGLVELQTHGGVDSLRGYVSKIGEIGTWPSRAQVKEAARTETFLSGMIFTLWTWPVVSKI